MTKKIFLSFLFVAICSVSLYATKAPTLPISYNSVPVSARGIAMGYAGVGLLGHIDGVYFNPASLGYNPYENLQVEAAFSVMRQSDIDDNILNRTDPVGVGFNSVVVLQQAGAVSWRTLSSHKISENNGSNWYKKEESIKAVTISAANKTENGGSAGINISYLYGTIAESSMTNGTPFAQTASGNGFTIDVGYAFPLSSQFVFGINLENVVGFMWWGDYDYDQLPFGIKTGLGFISGSFSLAVDYDKKFYRFGNYDDTLLSAGLEQYITSAFCIRLGAQGTSFSDKDSLKLTYGIGLNVSVVSMSVSGESFKQDGYGVSKFYFSLKAVV